MEVEWALRTCSDRSSGVVMVFFSFPCFLSLSIPSSHLVNNDPLRHSQETKHKRSTSVSRIPDRMLIYVFEWAWVSASEVPTAG